MQRSAVFEVGIVAPGEDVVQLADGIQRMDVCGVAVVILVLHEAGKGIELGNEPPQHAQFMHLAELGMDRADVLEDGFETCVGIGGIPDVLVDQRTGLADERFEVEMDFGPEALRVAEHADEAGRVILKRAR